MLIPDETMNLQNQLFSLRFSASGQARRRVLTPVEFSTESRFKHPTRTSRVGGRQRHSNHKWSTMHDESDSNT